MSELGPTPEQSQPQEGKPLLTGWMIVAIVAIVALASLCVTALLTHGPSSNATASTTAIKPAPVSTTTSVTPTTTIVPLPTLPATTTTSTILPVTTVPPSKPLEVLNESQMPSTMVAAATATASGVRIDGMIATLDPTSPPWVKVIIENSTVGNAAIVMYDPNGNGGWTLVAGPGSDTHMLCGTSPPIPRTVMATLYPNVTC